MNSMPFGQLKSFLKILIGVQYDTEKSYRRGNCPGGIFLCSCGRITITVRNVRFAGRKPQSRWHCPVLSGKR